MHWRLIYCALLLFNCVGFSQQLIPKFETLDVEDGLSQNSVYQIYQDKRGFMWFGTAEGLNRYDGEKIRVFKYVDKDIVKANANNVRGWICEDKRGRIWYANETGIYFFDPLKEKVERAHDFLKETAQGFVYYKLLYLDDEENLWLSIPLVGLVKHSTKTHHSEFFKYPKGFNPLQFSIQPQVSKEKFYFQFNGYSGVLTFDVASLKYEWILSGYSDVIVNTNDGKCYYVKDKQLFQYDPNFERHQLLVKNFDAKMYGVIEDRMKRLWISSVQSGIYRYDFETQKIIQYRYEPNNQNSLSDNVTTSLYIDNKENLWIGTDGGGVSRLNLKAPRFNIFPAVQGVYGGVNDFFIRCFYEDESGRIWLGTLLSGLVIYDPATGTLTNYAHKSDDANSLQNNSVGAIFKDREGTIYIAHDAGVSIFDLSRNTFLQIPISSSWLSPYLRASLNRSFQIFQTSRDEILVCTHFGVFEIKRNQRGVYEQDIWKGFTSNVSGISETGNGDIWIATEVEGLFRVKTLDSSANKDDKFFSRINLRGIHADEQNNDILWLCSGAGLIWFDTKTLKYKLYNEKDGVPGSFVYGVVEDQKHNFWLSTNAGLCYFDRSNNTFQSFTVNDGLQSNEFNTGAFYKGRSGNIYFGGIKGFNWFGSGVEKSESGPPTVSVVSTWVNDEPIVNDSTLYYSKSLTLPYNQNDIDFEVAVFDYTRPEANKIQYKLEGWDNQWVTTNQKLVRYSNLSPGEYTFKVRASSSGSTWGEEEHVTVSIDAPFWNTRLFYFVIGFAGVGMIAGVTRMIANRRYEKKLQELEKQRAVLEERERISKDIHDDLGSGLSKISILSELARQSKTADDFTQRQLEKISGASHELIDNISELIWSHNPANDTLSKLFSYSREHLSLMFDMTQSTLRISTPEMIEDKQVPAVWRRNIFLATKECLHNVLKHADAKQIELEFRISNNSLTVEVRDNGRGFNADEKIGSGNGLLNIKKRIYDCGGEVYIKSSPGVGTSIRFEVPLNF